MSQPGQRNRVGEPSELQRQQLRDQDKCIDCRRPSKTQRCASCAARVEANTERYIGQPRKGAPLAIVGDLKDLEYAMAALGKAHAGFHAVSQRSNELSTRQRREALSEWVAQLNLAIRFARGVFRRNPLNEEQPQPLPRPPPRREQHVVQLSFKFFNRRVLP